MFAPHQYVSLTNWQPRSTAHRCAVYLADLPFAQLRFCGAEGLTTLSPSPLSVTLNSQAYGVAIADGPLKGLAARAVVVIDENDNVIFSQLVDEITEPDYEAALAVLKRQLICLMLHHQAYSRLLCSSSDSDHIPATYWQSR